jgi:MFS family permease
MTTATLDLQNSSSPGAPAPAQRKPFLVLGYGVFTLAAPVLAVVAMIWFSILEPFRQQDMPEWQAYLLCAPAMLVAVACCVLGALLLVVRRPWVLNACVAGGVVLAAVYAIPQAIVHHGRIPPNWISLCFLAIPTLLLVARKPALAQLRATMASTSLEFGPTLSIVGDLVYTKMGLLALFSWLLWFDFCFSIMETVMNPILQFRVLNELNMDPFWYTFFLGTIPGIINFVLNPIISIKSDRHRGPRGRRIPFLLYGAPVVCLCLALMGFGNDIAAWLQTRMLSSWSLAQVTIGTFVTITLIFTVFNMFMGTTFYYLFNDVVPEKHFIKFMAYFRVVGALAGMIYSWCIFGYSDKTGPLNINLGFFQYHNEHFWYPKLILVGAAVFYTIAASLPLLMVREPSYPPPPPYPKGDGFLQKNWKVIQTITKECFCHRFYVILFITLTVEWMGYQMGGFMNPMRKDLGMDLSMLGKFGAISGGIFLILTLATANLGDRFRPLPLFVFSMALSLTLAPISLLFLIPGLSSTTYLWIELGRSFLGLPIGLIMAMASSPLLMSIMPRDRFGQFSAASSMIRMIIAGILGSMLAGWLMSAMKGWWGNYALRTSFVWSVFFAFLTGVCYYLLYREWKKLGGREGFTPPPVDEILAKNALAKASTPNSPTS